VVEASDIFASCEKENAMKFEQFELSLLRIIVSVHFGHELEGVERLLYIL
jgi:hypothetical protein